MDIEQWQKAYVKELPIRVLINTFAFIGIFLVISNLIPDLLISSDVFVTAGLFISFSAGLIGIRYSKHEKQIEIINKTSIFLFTILTTISIFNLYPTTTPPSVSYTFTKIYIGFILLLVISTVFTVLSDGIYEVIRTFFQQLDDNH